MVRKREDVSTDGDQDSVEAVAGDIRRYLASHPDAGDSANGIHRWWLSADVAQTSRETVESALDRLVVERVLVRRRLPDGEAFYAVPAPRRGRD